MNFTELFTTIPLRHSTRTFIPTRLDEETIKRVSDFANSLILPSLPFECEIKFKFFKATPGKGLYNNGVSPIDNIALVAQTDLISISKVGFVGEIVMLYATNLGLSTCWFGHYKLSELGKYIEGIASKEYLKQSTLGFGYGNHVNVGERVICCIPFGNSDAESKRLIDHIMKKLGANRKPLAELIVDTTTLPHIPQDIIDVFNIARLAPSAGNSQMWRFEYDKNKNIITVAKPVGYKHFKWEHPDVDIGICAAHIWIGLLEKGYTPKVTVKQAEERAIWQFDLKP
jgi:nitroreductase